MFNHRYLLIVFIASSVTSFLGCATPEERASRRQTEVERMRYTCAQYGYTPGTVEFARCVQSQDQTLAQKKEKETRQSLCQLGNKSYCDNKPKKTYCAKDVFGNYTCSTE